MFGLPVATGPQDLLRNGFSNAEHEMKAPHPVQGLDKRSEVNERDLVYTMFFLFFNLNLDCVCG